MFLEDKLENMFTLGTEFPDLTNDLAVDLANACVGHIKERTHEGMSVRDAVQVIKQTDNIWRRFAKKHTDVLREDFFTEVYIKPRIMNHPQMGQYFQN